MELVDTTDLKSVAFTACRFKSYSEHLYTVIQIIISMYLILIKYFYYFYYLKKNKKFKFFILLDLIFFLMKKYFKLLILKKKLIKYKNILRKSLYKFNLQVRKNILSEKPYLFFKITKQLYLLSKVDMLIKKKIDAFNDFIITFLPSQLLPLGNRKKFYNLINKKFKRFFVLIKKKLNKKFFFYYLVQMFRKIKFLFVKSDAFLNKKTFLFDFFSTLSLESKYSSLLQYYRQHNKKDSLLKNKFLSFFNLISFFLYRLDFFLFKMLSFFSISNIRDMIFNTGVMVNNKRIKTIHYFLNKYDLLQIPSSFLLNFKKLYIFALKYFFDFMNKYSYKKLNNIKLYYYVELYKKIKNFSSVNLYLTQIPSSKKIKNMIGISYIDLMDEVFGFFFKLKKNKFSSIYNFDLLNVYKGNYKVEFQFPFFLKQKKKDLFFNNNINYLNNVSYTINNSSTLTKHNIFNLSYLNNFINLYFFLFKFRLYFYYSKKNNIIVSPMIVNTLFKEQKKLFYYFSILYHVNFVKLI